MTAGVLLAQCSGLPVWGILVKMAPSKPDSSSPSCLPLSAITAKRLLLGDSKVEEVFSHQLGHEWRQTSSSWEEAPLSTRHDGALRRQALACNKGPLVRRRGQCDAKDCASAEAAWISSHVPAASQCEGFVSSGRVLSLLCILSFLIRKNAIRVCSDQFFTPWLCSQPAVVVTGF